MKIVADENIPNIEHYFGGQGELLLKPGRLITRDDLFDADMLLVRSVTKINELLLHNTPVKFVGSTVAGLDHIDTEYLERSGIRWCAAEGCNARSVAEYVVCVIAALKQQGYLNERELRAAVIGVGQIGRLVVDHLQALGFEVLQCDPLRASTEADFKSSALEDILECDLISIHTPLTHHGKFPTHHLIEKEFLKRQKPNAILLNAGRGAVINFSDLKKYGSELHWCLDVFENEPMIDLEVLERAAIATPHIAGHSVESKLRGVEMVYRAVLALGLLMASPKQFSYPEKIISFHDKKVDWREVVLKIFDPVATSSSMKKNLLMGTDTFDGLRQKFVERHEFGFVKLESLQMDEVDKVTLQKLIQKA